MEMSGNTAVGVATAEFKGCLENGGSETVTKAEAFNDDVASTDNITALDDDTANLNTVQNDIDNNEGLSVGTQTNDNIHDPDFEAPANTDNNCLSHEIQADNNNNKEDVIRIGLPKDSLEPTEVNIQNAIGRSEIHPENIPSYARRCPDWNFLGRDSYYSMKKERQPLEKCLPIKNRYSFSERLNLQLTTENRLCVIVLVGAVDTHTKRIKPKAIEILSSFPPNSFTAYYSIGGQDIEILCRYSKEIGIEHQEFGNIFEGIHAVKILSAGDFWETRGYLYDTEFFGLIESPAVDIALKKFQHRCAELKEEKRLYDEKINRMAAELATRSREIQEAEDARRLAAKTATVNMTLDEAATSDTATTDTASSKPTVEATNDVSGLDFSDFFTPYESDTTNGEQTPSVAQESELPDVAETDVVTEFSPVNTETVASEKISDTVQGDETTLAQTNALTSTTTQIEETKVLCLDMESEIPDEELKKIQEIADYVKIPDGVPRTTEDGNFNWGALTDDTGDSPEVTLADFGITSCETIPADHNFAPSNAIIVNKKGKRINTDSFPYVLKLIKNWVLYRVIYDRKVPKDSRTGKNAKSNDSSTWSSFDESVTGFVKYNADGIGIELTLVTYILVFDLDHVRNPETGELHPLVKELLNMLPEDSVFVEISQSGTGLHLFFQYTKGLDLTIFTKCKMTAVFGDNTCFECYTHDRFIAMTGNLLSEKFANIRPSTEVDNAITQIYKRCLDIYNGGKVNSKPKTDSKPAPALSRPAPKLSDDDIIRLAYKNSEKFRKLAHKDISDYDNDDSRADAAFIYILAFYTKDPEQLDRIYRRWLLARDKWDSPRGESTYGKNLIQQALREVTAQYYPQENISISSIDEPFSFDINYLKKIKLNEIATAALFADAVRKIVIYTYDTKEYYYYNGKYWQLNKSDMKIRQIAKQFVLYIDSIICAAEKKLSESKDEGEDVEDEKRLLAKMGQYYSKFTKLSSRNRLIEDIQDEIVHSSEEFDKDPYKLCVENGVLDLEAFNPASGKTEKLLPHRPEFMISKIANVYYDPNKNEAKFHQVLDTILDHNNDKKRYLSSILGYTLLGEAYEEQFYLILGKSTRNGKSLVFESYANLLGLNEGYSRQISAQTLLYSSISKSGSDPMPDIVRLKGTRMIVASEPKKGSVLNVELLKQLTGNDQICARTLHSGTYSQFENAGTIFLLANNSPDFSDDTIMDSDRLKIVTFNHHFSEQERDITLKNIFKTDSIKSTMLNFALSGLTDYLSKGMKPYMGMKQELQEYSYSSDYLQQFLDENVTVLPDSEPISHGIKLSSLRKIYSVFAKDTGFTPCGLRLFREDLIKHFIRVERHDNQYYVACRIKGEMSLDDVKSKADGAWRMKYRENNNR